MIINEKAMLFLEAKIPELAEAATKAAYLRALAAGHSVLECRHDTIIEVFPDGQENVIKKIAPPTKVTITKLEIR